MIGSSSATYAELLRAPRGTVAFVDVPDHLFAGVEGVGAPEDAGFASAVAVLYPVASGVRFALRPLGVDVKVAPLEAQWWTEGKPSSCRSVPRSSWRWRAMIRLPDRRVEDPRRTAPERLRTILRQPVTAVPGVRTPMSERCG